MGQHEEAIATLKRGQDAMQVTINAVADDVADIKRLLDERRGERRALAKVSAIAGGLTGSVLTLLLKVGLHLPK